MKRTHGFTLIELMVVIAIIAILAGIIVPRVSSYISRSRATRALAEIKGIELALTTMMNDAGKTSLNQFFSTADPPVWDPATDGYDFAVMQAAVETYTNTFYVLLRKGRTTLAADLPAGVVLRSDVIGKLGSSYMDLTTDPFGNKYRIFPGPWRISSALGPIPFRAYRGTYDADGLPIVYVYDADAKIEADADVPGNPQADDGLGGFDAFGFPAARDLAVYIWSVGENQVSDQIFDDPLEDDYKGGGDDINNWDPKNAWGYWYN